jgi:hypothetical protein
MFSKGQARFPLLLTLFLLAGLALSQTEGLPPSLLWDSQSTEASWDGSVFSASNTFTASNAPAGTLNVIISGCPADWICLADPSAIEHSGADANYPINLMIIAPQDASGTLIVTASDGMEANSNEWSVSVNPAPQQPPEVPSTEPPPEEPPPEEQPPANETQPPEETPPVSTEGFAQISSCGTIRGNTVLTEDILAYVEQMPDSNSFISPRVCLIFASNDAVLDCRGHAIVGTGHGNGIEAIITDGKGPLTIKNCDISGFANGMMFNANGVIVEDTKVHDNAGYGIYVGGGTEFVLQRSSVYNNAMGINSQSIDGFNILDSTFTDNGIGLVLGIDTAKGTIANVKVEGGIDGIRMREAFDLSFHNVQVQVSGTGLFMDSSERNSFVGGKIAGRQSVVIMQVDELTGLAGSSNLISGTDFDRSIASVEQAGLVDLGE